MSEILEETGWDYSGLVDLVQGNPEKGKDVLKRIIDEISALEPEIYEIEKQLSEKKSEYNGLLTHCCHLQRHLRWPNPFNYAYTNKTVYSIQIAEDGVSVTKKELL
jgi:hypothetical protein